MKRLITCLLAMFVLSCSSDDDTTNLDLNLLYGQWYRVGLCAEQNSLLLNSNGTFTSYASGAIDCNDPEPDTHKYTGTYEISGDFYYPNEQTRELIIDGTNITVFDFEDPNIKREIIELTETTLVIKVYLDNGNNTIDLYGEYTYEH
ncbi:hypothetical protein [Winogradskyella endarachnes]|uniref:Lipocalin-like domain-containing protein n=1 Tax=Winogradskyella endarachnes TaxID=2681965 RepID=A0A6L6UBN6_9FLAO|nr:hypothetical protein [Winogradskyella endarachnes]MUU79638.1 hypothetical protein [Winogradskyella endarachnes]